MIDRRSAVAALLKDRGDSLLVVAGLGAPAWDCTAAGDHDLTFPLWGAMGGAVPMGLGLAQARPDKRVLVVTGDGEILMGLGSLTAVGSRKPPNLAIVVLDNERYGETGMQKTNTGRSTDLAAIAKASGIPYGQGLVKNRYIGRTFIAPTQEMRALGVRMKLNPLRDNIAGKRLVVVDDSIVRGTTTRAMVAMLREAGALEVHMRISSPPYKWPCFYGMDTGTRSELLAAQLEIDEIRDYLGVDTLAYLTLDRLKLATGTGGAGFCDACLTGDYPVEVPVELSKDVLEKSGCAPHEREQLVEQHGGGLTLFGDTPELPADAARRARQAQQ